MKANTQAPQTVWAKYALLGNQIKENVLFTIDAAGNWQSIEAGKPKPANLEKSVALALPGVVNAHSHAFQRAFAGLSEIRQSATDDFWSWREKMYVVANQVDPEQLEAIASFLYLELLKNGFTHVCEFNYLLRDKDNQLYSDKDCLEGALLRAAQKTGIGITLMPVLYERSGFTSTTLNPHQQRFKSDVQICLDRIRVIQSLIDAIEPNGSAQNFKSFANTGLAIHSLRAAEPKSIFEIKERANDFAGPIHIHVAEQTQEVKDSIAATGKRPLEWLIHHKLMNEKWALVHVTHTTPQEIAGLGETDATVVICPTTEANLGDGIADLQLMLQHQVPIAVGTDSHINRSAFEEMRWLEYVQRLQHQKRNFMSHPPKIESTAHRCIDLLNTSSAKISGQTLWGFVAGSRADLLGIDIDQPCLAGIPPYALVDALVFSSPALESSEVMVKGQWCVEQGKHSMQTEIEQKFVQAMHELYPSKTA